MSKRRIRRLNKLNWVWEKVGKDGSTTIDGYYSSLRSALVCGLDAWLGGSDTNTILKSVRDSTEEVLEAFYAAVSRRRPAWLVADMYWPMCQTACPTSCCWHPAVSCHWPSPPTIN